MNQPHPACVWEPGPSNEEIRMRKVFVLVVVAALTLVACGGDDDSSGSNAPVQLQGTVNDKGTKTVSGSVTVEADDFYFKPTFMEAQPGSKLSLEIENEGNETHTFTIDSAKIDETIDPGKKAEVEVTVPSSGDFNFYCRFHRSQGMQGAIVAK
jgi:plastocyanin